MASSGRGRRELDTPTKNRIIGYWRATGNAAEAGRKENVKPRVAQYVVQHYKERGTTANKPRTGRPSKLTEYDKREIVRVARKNRRMPLAEITNNIATKVSVATVRRVLAARGYHRRVAKRVPFINHKHKQLRYAWGRMYRKWKRRRWRHVIFSDECYICLGDKRGRIFITRRTDELLLEECLVPTFKQSPIHIMVWGCIAEGRKGPLIVVDYPGGKGGGLNSEVYQQQILEGPLLSFYNEIREERHFAYFQQDGAPSHTSKSTTNWLQKNKIKLAYHPPNSPDLTPIEPVWSKLKSIIRRQQRTPTTVEELKAAALAAWEEIPLDLINKHISRMPDRVAAVLAARGGHTGF
ncbi:hypothetical protein CVT26_012771 [Gymnopilus dilepis]|uniref:Tc1-like transposase DDE domain-containing protein n=1 Tax=Gymnopilus dilepis TaxID=231916 RepID=A0A409YVY0_9AGAR|nr:hypothetical protein CVT26_012771 [Gymnopilus dilepis]